MPATLHTTVGAPSRSTSAATVSLTEDSEVTSQRKAHGRPPVGGDGGHGVGQVVLGHVEGGHRGPLRGQADGHRPTDARAGSGDHGHLVGEPVAGEGADGGVGGVVLGAPLPQGDPLDRTHGMPPVVVACCRRLYDATGRRRRTARAGCASGSCRPGCGAPRRPPRAARGWPGPAAPAPSGTSTMSSKSKAGPPLTATTAQARSPVFGSGRPMTATSATAGWL